MKTTSRRFTQTINSAILGCTIMGFLAIATTVKAQTITGKWVAPANADALKNPQAGNPSAVKDGKTLYISYCAPCHGEKGKGDGVAGGALSPKPANHTAPVVQNQTDGAIFWKLSEGRNAMAAYKNSLTETQRWNLVCFIRSLKK
jgi:mono/diheme cytochrome c family protein